MSHTSAESVTKTAGTEEQFFTLWTVFKRSADVLRSGDAAQEFDALEGKLAEEGVTLRGSYDVSAMRSDADIMVWLHGSKPEDLQSAVRSIRRSKLFAGTEIVWSAMGVHREAEFAKSHVPAYARGVEPSTWLCVYPFVRSYEWYLLDDSERRRMLAEHGQMAREFADVRANTVASFALGDYEWMLAFEADELHRIVDLMRHLRASDARRHVREELPFYTGRRISPADLVALLP